jgi:hypothetical protein
MLDSSGPSVTGIHMFCTSRQYRKLCDHATNAFLHNRVDYTRSRYSDKILCCMQAGVSVRATNSTVNGLIPSLIYAIAGRYRVRLLAMNRHAEAYNPAGYVSAVSLNFHLFHAYATDLSYANREIVETANPAGIGVHASSCRGILSSKRTRLYHPDAS